MTHLTLSDCSGCVHKCNTADWTETVPDRVMSQLTLSDCSGCVHNCNTAHWTETIPDRVMSQLTLSDCSGCVHKCNTADWTETIPDRVMSQLTLSDCSGCVHNCNTADWTETIPDQVMSQLHCQTAACDCAVSGSVLDGVMCHSPSTQWLTAAGWPLHFLNFPPLFDTTYHGAVPLNSHQLMISLSWLRHPWSAIRWHNMQHDVTAVLTVYTAVTVISLNVMVSVSSEDQEGLLGFCL
jgi:hypothetical protein